MVARCLLLCARGLGSSSAVVRTRTRSTGTTLASFEVILNGVQSPTAAITSELPTLITDVASPAWLMDALGGTIRMRVTPTVTGQPIFVGIGSSADVDAYLAGVTHDTITAVAGHSTTLERSSTGVVAAESPTEQQNLGSNGHWCRPPATQLERSDRGQLGSRRDERGRPTGGGN